MKRSIFIAILFFLVMNAKAQDEPKNTKVNQVKKICEGMPLSDKPMIAVVPFKISVPNVSAQVATGFPDMLVNAIFNTGCFRVVDRDRLKDIMQEQGLGQSGAGDDSFAQAGRLAGAQVLVMGTITEFNEKAG